MCIEAVIQSYFWFMPFCSLFEYLLLEKMADCISQKKGFLYFRWASWKCDKQSDLVFDPFGFVQGLNLRYCIHQSDSHLYFCSLVDGSVIVFT